MKTSDSPLAPLDARAEELLTQTRKGINSTSTQKEAIKSTLFRRIQAPVALTEAARQVAPTSISKKSVWSRIAPSLDPDATTPLWERIRSALDAPAGERTTLWQRISARLAPESLFERFPVVRWVGAFAVFLVLARVTLLSFAPPSAADTSVLLRPQHGVVSVLIGGLLQPVDHQITIEKSALIQTAAGASATIIMHGYAVIRLDENTSFAIHDVSSMPDLAVNDPTVTLYDGRAWIQSFLPKTSRGLSVGTAQGKVLVNEGSVNIAQKTEDSSTDVRVWNRSATIVRSNEEVALFAGDHVLLHQDQNAFVSKMGNSADDSWTKKNLQLDIVHQHEIAQLQQQRLAARAGTLPTSSLYPIKRLAEQVDVLLTLGSEARAAKQLDQANTRLNEAAALLQQGNTKDAQAPLQEYKDSMLALATGSGDTAVQSLVSETVAQASANLSAVMPDDTGSYTLKEAVFETSAALPEALTPSQVFQARVFLDQLSALKTKLEEGTDLVAARKSLTALETQHDTLQKEAALLGDTEEEAAATLDAVQSLLAKLEDVDRLARAASGSSSQIIVPLLPEQVDAIARHIVRDLTPYTQERSLRNQMIADLTEIRGKPDEGRILRRLLVLLPYDSLKHMVELRIQELKQSIEQ